MKLSIEKLKEMSDEHLYHHLKKNEIYYTKKDLKELIKEKYISTNDTKDQLLFSVCHPLAINIIHNFLGEDPKSNYLKLNKVEGFTPKQKMDFIENYSVYLEESDLRSLLSSEKTVPKYIDLLKEEYLNVQRLKMNPENKEKNETINYKHLWIRLHCNMLRKSDEIQLTAKEIKDEIESMEEKARRNL
jgi:hypothetical protein